MKSVIFQFAPDTSHLHFRMFSSFQVTYEKQKGCNLFWRLYFVWSEANLPDKRVNKWNGSWYQRSVTNSSGCAKSQFPVHCFLKVNTETKMFNSFLLIKDRTSLKQKIEFDPLLKTKFHGVEYFLWRWWSLTNKEIPRSFSNLNVHYRIHKILLLEPILMNKTHNVISCWRQTNRIILSGLCIKCSALLHSVYVYT